MIADLDHALLQRAMELGDAMLFYAGDDPPLPVPKDIAKEWRSISGQIKRVLEDR